MTPYVDTIKLTDFDRCTSVEWITKAVHSSYRIFNYFLFASCMWVTSRDNIKQSLFVFLSLFNSGFHNYTVLGGGG